MKQKLFLSALALVMLVATLATAPVAVLKPKKDDQVFPAFVIQSQNLRSLTVYPEASKRLYAHATSFGKRVVWANGVVDDFYISNASLERMTRTHPKSEVLAYEASFVKGLVSNSSWRRVDGTLLKDYRSDDSGNKFWQEYHEDGLTVVKEHTRFFDGRVQILDKRSRTNKPVIIAAKSEKKAFGEQKLVNGRKINILTVNLVSGSLRTWEWYKGDGTVRLNGTILPSGVMEVKISLDGRLRAIQTFVPYLEDEHRYFYRLAQVKILAGLSGELLYGVIHMNKDGQTMRLWEDFMGNGNRNFTKYYDDQGRLYKTEDYLEGKLISSKETDPALGNIGNVNATYGPGVGGDLIGEGLVFQLAGEAFPLSASSNGDVVATYFSEPGKVLYSKPVEHGGDYH